MVGLIDIAPNVETIMVQGASVAVHGVSAKGVAHLLGRFPELRMLMTAQEVETEQLLTMGGDAAAAIVAAGCKAMTRLWAKREAQINCVIESTVGMYGDLQGIAGKALQEIEGLNLWLLESPAEPAEVA